MCSCRYYNLLQKVGIIISRSSCMQHGNLVPKDSIFSFGMKALADYVHSKGLKIGIYADAG